MRTWIDECDEHPTPHPRTESIGWPRAGTSQENAITARSAFLPLDWHLSTSECTRAAAMAQRTPPALCDQSGVRQPDAFRCSQRFRVGRIDLQTLHGCVRCPIAYGAISIRCERVAAPRYELSRVPWTRC